jgi:4'-phosphopantetheinyl transferase
MGTGIVESASSPYWFEQSDAELPADNDWLSESERCRLQTLVIPKRRREWRLGRWTLKCAVSGFERTHGSECAIEQVEVTTASSGAPSARTPRGPLFVSLSHRAGRALAVVTEIRNPVGCDLELVEPRPESFVRDYFTVDEQVTISQRQRVRERDLLTTLIWSAKESALKALKIGLQADTRDVAVLLRDTIDYSNTVDWQVFDTVTKANEKFRCWWRASELFIRTIAGPHLRCPVSLNPHFH